MTELQMTELTTTQLVIVRDFRRSLIRCSLSFDIRWFGIRLLSTFADSKFTDLAFADSTFADSMFADSTFANCISITLRNIEACQLIIGTAVFRTKKGIFFSFNWVSSTYPAMSAKCSVQGRKYPALSAKFQHTDRKYPALSTKCLVRRWTYSAV